MTIVLTTPAVDELADAIHSLAEWQLEGGPVQLHPGDLGWNYRFGADATARATRTWSRDGRLLALGMFDGPDLLRLGVAPDAVGDEELASRMTTDVAASEAIASVEARGAETLRRMLRAEGWVDDEPWAPLVRDLTHPVELSGLRVEVVGPGHLGDRVAVQRAAFERSIFTVESWRDMAAGPAYGDARCLVGYDDAGAAVAAATVWSAGPGRPGLLEPMGVHRDHRGHGYGTAITRAAASALRDLGSSSATVCTDAANIGGVATYVAAGFRRLPDVTDLAR